MPKTAQAPGHSAKHETQRRAASRALDRRRRRERDSGAGGAAPTQQPDLNADGSRTPQRYPVGPSFASLREFHIPASQEGLGQRAPRRAAPVRDCSGSPSSFVRTGFPIQTRGRSAAHRAAPIPVRQRSATFVAGFDGKPRSPRADASPSASIRSVSPGHRQSLALSPESRVLVAMDFRQNPPRNQPVSAVPWQAAVNAHPGTSAWHPAPAPSEKRCPTKTGFRQPSPDQGTGRSGFPRGEARRSHRPDSAEASKSEDTPRFDKYAR